MANKFNIRSNQDIRKMPARHTVTLQFTLATIKDDGEDVLGNAMVAAVIADCVNVHGVGVRCDSLLVNGLDVYAKNPKRK